MPTLTAPDSLLMSSRSSSVLLRKDGEQDLAQEVVEDQDRHRADHDRARGRDADAAAAARGVVSLVATQEDEREPEEGALQETLHHQDRLYEFFEVEDELPVVHPLPDHRNDVGAEHPDDEEEERQDGRHDHA